MVIVRRHVVVEHHPVARSACPDVDLRCRSVSSNSSRLSARVTAAPGCCWPVRRRGAGVGLAVPRGADDVRAAKVAGLERHHHLAADLRQDLQALVLVRVRRAQRRPGPHVAVAVLTQGREADLDPAAATRGRRGRSRAPGRPRSSPAPQPSTGRRQRHQRHLVHGGALGLEAGPQPALRSTVWRTRVT